MDFRQTHESSSVPEAGSRPRWSDLSWLPAYAARGLWELILAHRAFSALEARDIPRLNQDAKRDSAKNRGSRDDIVRIDAHSARIGYVLPRISARLPWRSDCLVQALAARRWLLASGLASEIRIGVERPDNADFGAHAWLVRDGHVITGGDISRYSLLLGGDAHDQADPRKVDGRHS